MLSRGGYEIKRLNFGDYSLPLSLARCTLPWSLCLVEEAQNAIRLKM
jgi:hypothetical protein